MELFRAKREVPIPSPPSPSVPTRVASPPASASSQPSQQSNAAAAPAATSQTKVSQIDAPNLENSQRLLGVNGTGQRKDYSTVNGTKTLDAVALSTQQPNNPDNKPSAINKSLTATQSNNSSKAVETPVSDDEEKLIEEIDEPDDTIQKTVDDHTNNQPSKTDYFQYYNSTTTVDKNKSDEYWSQKKDFIISSILSKSHRRAIVSVQNDSINSMVSIVFNVILFLI